MPQLVIRGDDFGGVYEMRWDVGDVALEAQWGPVPGDGGLIQGGVTSVDGAHVLGTLLAGDDGLGLVGLSCEGLVVPGRALFGVGPTPLSTSPGG